MNIYTEKDIEQIKTHEEQIKNEIDDKKNMLFEPTLEERIAVHNIILNFIREKKRKIYGGYAIHMLLLDKKHAGLYKKNKIPDVDIYSPEPLNDLPKLANLLFDKKFKYVVVREAQHKETYTISVNNFRYCDFSYVPKNIYSRIPYLEVNGLICVHPNFMTIDYLRMISDPLVSAWRFFDDNFKALRRLMIMLEQYPIRRDKSDLKVKKNTSILTILENINKFCLDKDTIVLIGYYAYNCYCREIEYNPVNAPFYEFISSNYKNDALELIKFLKTQHTAMQNNITHKEFYPFFQFIGHSTEIYLNDVIICKIYHNNNRCVPFQNIIALNNPKNKVKLGTFAVITMYIMSNAMKYRSNKNKDMENQHYQMFTHCVQMRNEYFEKNKKTVIDNTIFKDFIVTCIGETIEPDRERLLLIESRKKRNKKYTLRYEPSEEGKRETLSGNYKFPNSSGNEIHNDKNLKLSNIIDVDDSDDKENEENETESHVIDGGSDHTFRVKNTYYNLIKSGKKKYEGRLNKGLFTTVKLHDIINWENEDESVATKVLNIYKFDTFSNAIVNVGLMNILPNMKNLEDGVNVYKEFYTDEDEKKYEVLIFELILI